MTSENTTRFIIENAKDVRFAPLIAAALGILNVATVKRDRKPTPLPESSKSVADLHAFRSRMGYYRPGAVVGLEESVAALAERDVPVSLGSVETDQGYIAVWLDERGALLGVMIFIADPSQ